MKYRIIFILAVLPFVFGCAKDLVTGKTVLNYYSLESEPKFGNQVLEAQLTAARKGEKKIDYDADPAEFDRLKGIVGRLAPVTHHPAFPYEVHLVDVDVVNAWCAPGGKMMVYTGLWSTKDGLVQKGNDDELAAVLAHEMGHANARHVTEAISRNLTIAMAGAVAQGAIQAGGYAQGADLFGEIFSQGFNIFVPSYSRQNEFEADRLGLLYMAMAGYDPRKAVELWKKAATKKKDRTSIYASHPASGVRAKKLEELLPEAMQLYEKSKTP